MANYDPKTLGCQGGWQRCASNPLIGDENDFCFDNYTMRIDDHYRMYFSWRTHYAIAYTESADGIHWGERHIVLSPRKNIPWEEDVNRPTLLNRNGKLLMWYSAQTTSGFHQGKWVDQYLDASLADSGTSVIAFAYSDDGGETWQRLDEPVLIPDQPWEKQSLMNPTVLWNSQQNQYQMWYCGGGWFEPDCIGYATSKDGIHWTKHANNPVFTANPDQIWERERVAGPSMMYEDDWYYLFYIGYEDLFKTRICAARSKNGVDNWQRHPQNPLISGGMPGAWDVEAAYKPHLLWDTDQNRWLMYFNARKGTTERIGLAIHPGRDLWK